MQSRDELRLEERRFYVWLGVAAVAHIVLIVSVVFFQHLYVRMHPPLKVVNVSLVSMPGLPGPAGGPKSLPAQPPPAPDTKAAKPESAAAKQVPEPPKPKPEPKAPKKVPEPSTVKKIPETSPVPDKTKTKPQPETASKKPAVSDERKNLQTALQNLKHKAESGPSNLGSTLATLQKKVASEGGGGTASSGSGSGVGGGRYGSGGGGAFDPYKVKIAEIIQGNWSFSRQMVRSTTGMEVYVSLYIMPDGSVKIHYDRKSTSQYLNSSVQRALEKSSPFPPLPKEYGAKGLWVGFVFTPEGIGQ